MEGGPGRSDRTSSALDIIQRGSSELDRRASLPPGPHGVAVSEPDERLRVCCVLRVALCVLLHYCCMLHAHVCRKEKSQGKFGIEMWLVIMFFISVLGLLWQHVTNTPEMAASGSHSSSW